MNKTLLLSAARFAPRFFQVRRSTWIGIGVGLMFLAGLLVWAAIALMGWFFGQVQGWSAAAPEAARDALATVEQQAERVLPGLGEKVAAVESILKPTAQPRRDVSGTDFAPVARYPGLARSFWHREGKWLSVHYEGQADYAAVLDHYLQAFAALGYARDTQSAAPEAETHVWIKGEKRYVTKIAGEPEGRVSVEIESTLE